MPAQSGETHYRHKQSLRTIEERNRLVMDNQGLIRWVWNRNRHKACMRRLGEDDAISAGQLGLIRAAELFDESLDLKFSTYAPFWIRQAMQRAGAKEYTIHIPHHIFKSNCKEENLVAARNSRRIVSVSGVRGRLSASGRLDHEWEPFTEDPPVELDGEEELNNALRFVHKVYREPLLLHLRDGLKLHEIGDMLNCSKERVRQLINDGISKLRDRLGSKVTYSHNRRIKANNYSKPKRRRKS